MKLTMPSFKSKNSRIIASLAIALLLIVFYLLLRGENVRSISSQQLEVLMDKKLITRVVHKAPWIYVSTSKMKYRLPSSGVDMKKLARDYPIEIYEGGSTGILIVLTVVMSVALLLLLYLYIRKISTIEGGRSVPIGGVSLAREPESQSVVPIKSTVSFDDVAGIEEAKEELAEIIDFLNNPAKYRKLDLRLPKGVLLVGPPGVGKTYIAKAVAGEAGVPFFYQSGANFVEIYVGMGAKRVHALFQAAKKMAPSIIFIDEIDAAGKSRGGMRNDEREATLNQLLTEMDGFRSNSGIIVMAATNRIEMLDEALLRPGRFDRRIHIPLPDMRDRKEILSMYLKNKPHDLDIGELARTTVGFSAAALSTLVNEAALFAVRKGHKKIEKEDIEAVREKVISGKRKIISFSEEERGIQAVYQSGKALTATWLDIPFEKIGIVTTRMRETEREITSKSEFMKMIKVYLAGSAATWLKFEERYSNCSEDISRAREIAERILDIYAMGEEITPDPDEKDKILRSCYSDVIQMLKKLENARVSIEEHLLAHENITEEECRRILRELF